MSFLYSNKHKHYTKIYYQLKIFLPFFNVVNEFMLLLGCVWVMHTFLFFSVTKCTYCINEIWRTTPCSIWRGAEWHPV